MTADEAARAVASQRQALNDVSGINTTSCGDISVLAAASQRLTLNEASYPLCVIEFGEMPIETRMWCKAVFSVDPRTIVHINTSIFVSPSSGFHGNKRISKADENKDNAFVLPLCLMSVMRGSPAILAFKAPERGQGATMNPQKYLLDLYSQSRVLVLVTEVNTMQQDVIQSTTDRLNALGIVIVSRSLTPKNLVDVQQSNLSGVLGPNSRRMAYSTVDNRFYDLETGVEYVQPLTNAFPTNVPLVHNLDGNVCFWENQIVDVVAALTLAINDDNAPRLASLITVLERSTTETKFREAIAAAIIAIETRIAAIASKLNTTDFNEEKFAATLPEVIQNNAEARRQRIAVETYRRTKGRWSCARNVQRDCFKVVGDAQHKADISTVNANSVTQQSKRTSIQTNVNAVNTMDWDKFLTIVEACPHVVLLPIKTSTPLALQLAQEHTSAFISLDQVYDQTIRLTVPTFDGDVAAALIAISRDNGYVNEALTQTNQTQPSFVCRIEGRDCCTAFCLPMPSKAIETPLYNFRSVVDDPNVASIRILLAKSLSSMNASNNISPSHVNTRRFIALLYLWALENAPEMNEELIQASLVMAATSSWAGAQPASCAAAILIHSTPFITPKDNVDWQLMVLFARGSNKYYNSISDMNDETKASNIARCKDMALRTFVRTMVLAIRRYITALNMVQNPTIARNSTGVVGTRRPPEETNIYWARALSEVASSPRSHTRKARRVYRLTRGGHMRFDLKATFAILFGDSTPMPETISNAKSLLDYCEDHTASIIIDGAVAATATEIEIEHLVDDNPEPAVLIDQEILDLAQTNAISVDTIRLIREQTETLESFANGTADEAFNSAAKLVNIPVELMHRLLETVGFPMTDMNRVKVILDTLIYLITAHGTLQTDDVVLFITAKTYVLIQ